MLLQFANLLVIKFKLFNLSKKICQIALIIIEEFKHSKYTFQTRFIYSTFICRWFENEENVINELNKSIKNCKDNNLLSFAIYSIFQNVLVMLGAGKPLENIEKFIFKHNPFVYSVDFLDTILALEISKCYIQSLKSGQKNYQSSIFNENIAVKKMKENGLTVSYGWYMSSKLKTNYFLEDFENAKAFGNQTEECLDYLLGLNEVEEFHLYRSLSILNDATKRNLKLTKRQKKKIKSSIKYFKQWSKQNAQNYEYKYQLLTGAQLEYQKKYKKAELSFKRSLEMAHFKNQITIKALALEHLGKMKKRQCDPNAKYILQDAIKSYSKWGAKEKEKQLSKILEQI